MSLSVLQPGVALELDVGEECLYWGARRIELTPKAFGLLRHLVGRPNELASTESILAAVWPDVVVEEGQVKQFVAELRRILHDDPKAPRLIQTVRGRGYRYIGDIRVRPRDVAGGGRIAPPAAFDASAASRPYTPLIGREEELATLAELVAASPLVTLCGAGGVGKTLLARHLLQERRPQQVDGAVTVELSPLSDPDLVTGAVASALGLRVDGRDPLAGLVAGLADKRLLLVLDNAEHLVDEVARVVQALLAGAPRLHLLVTSQLPLRLAGEQIHRLGSLEVPAAGVPLDEARRYGAVALFTARARAAHQPFAVDAANLATVVEICTQLGGVPLAIELAAARVPSLGLTQLAAVLGERLQVLSIGQRGAPARQQNLKAALAWTHGLLRPDEQAVFRALGVFAGPFSLETAAQVVAVAAASDGSPGGERGGAAVANALAALVDCSLVGVDAADPPAYRLLLSTRLFARELLDAAGEAAGVRRRQLAHYTALVEQACSSLDADAERGDRPAGTGSSAAGDGWAVGRGRILREYSNIRGALEWAFAPGGDTAAGAALAVALLPFWQREQEGVEGQRWLQRSLAHGGPAGAAAVPAAGSPEAEARPGDATVALLMQRLQAEGVVGSAQLAGVEQAALMALARRLRPDDVRNFDAAVKELQRAVGIATQVVAQSDAADDDGVDAAGAAAEAPATPGPRGVVGAALARVARHTRIGELERAVDAIDAALAEVAHHEARQRAEIVAARRTLLEAGVQQDLLRRDAFGVARRIESIAGLAAPERPAWSAEYRAREARYLEEGRQQGVNLALEVGIELARRRVDSAADGAERCGALGVLGNALVALGERQSGTDALQEGIATYRLALTETPREADPLRWAALQNDLGVALRLIGMRKGDAEALAGSAAACRQALLERRRREVPLAWAETQHALGMALRCLGATDPGTATLEAAAEAFELALKERTPGRTPVEWAASQLGLGVAHSLLARREAGTARMVRAVQAYREALRAVTRETAPLEWANAQNNLGIELAMIGELQGDAATLREAVAAYREALKEFTRERVPPHWAMTQHNLGGALRLLGEREPGTSTLREAVVAFGEALRQNTRERAPLYWAASKNDLGIALIALGEREGDAALLEEAVRVLRQALEERSRDRGAIAWATTQGDLAQALSALGRCRGSVPTVQAAIDAWNESLSVVSPDSMPEVHGPMRAQLALALDWLRERG